MSSQYLKNFGIAPKQQHPPSVAYSTKESGNPTPIATCGLFIAFGTLACQLLFAQDTIMIESAAIPTHLFFGGFLITLGGALELCLRHYVAALALTFLGLSCFPFNKTLATTTSARNIALAAGVTPSIEISTKSEISALILGMILLAYLVSSFRTNIALVITIFSLNVGVLLASSAYWLHGGPDVGESEVGNKMLFEAGICFVVASACSCWILFSTLLEAIDYPFSLPVGNLSGE